MKNTRNEQRNGNAVRWKEPGVSQLVCSQALTNAPCRNRTYNLLAKAYRTLHGNSPFSLLARTEFSGRSPAYYGQKANRSGNATAIAGSRIVGFLGVLAFHLGRFVGRIESRSWT